MKILCTHTTELSVNDLTPVTLTIYRKDDGLSVNLNLPVYGISWTWEPQVDNKEVDFMDRRIVETFGDDGQELYDWSSTLILDALN